MTANNYGNMTNKQLDKAVAERVMGYVDRGIEYYIGERIDATENWHFTTNISQAFDVVEKMIADRWFVTIYGVTYDGDYGVDMFLERHNACVVSIDTVYDKSLPRAICIAALMAKESGSR